MIVNFNQFGMYEVPQLILCEPDSIYTGGASRYADMPTATQENLNWLVRYVGVSNDSYTSGMFYRCSIVNGGSGAASYTWLPVGLQEGLSSVIGEIPYCTDVENVFNFNDISRLDFRVHLPQDSVGNYEEVKSIYDHVLKHKYIFVQDYGYFMIEDVKNVSTEFEHYKDVSAYSCEVELKSRTIPYIEVGTYDIFHVLTLLREQLPLWVFSITEEDRQIFSNTIGARTFEDLDTNITIYDFITNNLQKAYDCVFVFDPMTRVAYVYAKSNYKFKTDVHLTVADVVNSITTTEQDIGAYSAMSGFGGDDLSFAAVNPLGTNVVYNMEYYIPWMPDGLGKKVSDWMTAVSMSEDEYYARAQAYYEALEQQSSARAEFERIDEQLVLYRKCYENVQKTRSAASADYYNDKLSEIGVDASKYISISSEIEETEQSLQTLIDETLTEHKAAQEEQNRLANLVADTYASMESIRESVGLSSYFNYTEYGLLVNYIYQGSYKNENIIITDVMDVKDKLSCMRSLYRDTKTKLSRVSSPVVHFDIDIDSFVFVQKFSRWTSQLQTGRTICVETEYGNMIDVFITSITVNYEDSKCSITFSNTLQRNSIKSLFEDVFEDITAGGSTFSHV